MDFAKQSKLESGSNSLSCQYYSKCLTHLFSSSLAIVHHIHLCVCVNLCLCVQEVHSLVVISVGDTYGHLIDIGRSSGRNHCCKEVGYNLSHLIKKPLFTPLKCSLSFLVDVSQTISIILPYVLATVPWEHLYLFLHTHTHTHTHTSQTDRVMYSYCV